jgi:hypothetical protein
MPAPLPPELPKKSRWKRWLWFPLALTGGITLVLLVLFLRLSGDEPAPDVADLTFTPAVLPPEENAFEVLKATGAKVDASPWRAEKELFDQMAKGKSWDAAKASQWLAANSHIWPELDRAAALPFSQGPLMKSLGEPGPEFAPLRQLTHLAMLRAWALQRDGKHEEAFAWLCTNLRIAQRIEDAHATIIMWLMGLALHGIALQTVETMALETPPSANSARELLRAMEETRPSVESLSAPIRNERLMLTLVLDQIQNGKSLGTDAGDFDRLRALSGKFGFLLKPHRTERLHAENLRAVLALIDADWPAVRAAIPPPGVYVGTGWRRWNPDNAVGRVLLTVVMPTLHSLVERRLRAQSLISAMEAFIAVRSFESEQGKLPEKLSDLVPRYLPQVPRDYYDRNEIRYSRELRAIWSIGKNNLSVTSVNPLPGTSEVCIRLGPKGL